MARISAWALAALLILPVYSRAAESACERAQPQVPQQRGQQPPQQPPQQPDTKNGRGDQGRQPPVHWWTDPQQRQQLGITDQQSKAVEDIWQKSLPDLRNLWHQLRGLEDQASKLILDGAPEAAVTAQIEQTEKTRAQLNKGRTLMLYGMFKVLKPEQRAKLIEMNPTALFDDHRDGRRGGSK
jgi:Spy/CpxP family protein refolding chaperone